MNHTITLDVSSWPSIVDCSCGHHQRHALQAEARHDVRFHAEFHRQYGDTTSVREVRA